jgi:hypothetical protein
MRPKSGRRLFYNLLHRTLLGFWPPGRRDKAVDFMRELGPMQ